MILVDRDIRRAMIQGEIKIDPYDERALGSNSYDVHLAPVLRVYEPEYDYDDWRGRRIAERQPLDVKKQPKTVDIEIHPYDGYVLEPGKLYLASTVEYTETHKHLPFLEGKSSLGRFGLSIHVTAGKGDVGFSGHWTMEMHVVGDPLRIYAGMAIGQLIYHEVSGTPDVSYAKKPTAKYNNRDPRPQASQYWRNFEEK